MVIQNKEGQDTKKQKVHKNLLIVFTIVGIVSFSLGALVNYHTLKKINK